MMHSSTRYQVLHDDIALTMNNIMKMHQEHGMKVCEIHVKLTYMHAQHIAHSLRGVNHALRPLCNTLLPHIPKESTSQGKHTMKGHYDMILPPK